MSKKKAYVRYAKNKAVAGSLILADKAPKVGIWKEVPADLCCGGGGDCNPDDTQSKIFLELRYGTTNCNFTTGYVLYIVICCNGILTLFDENGEIASDGYYQTRVIGDFQFSYQVINGQLIKIEDCV